MSDALRIALVAEGPTDTIVITSALRAILDGTSFVITQLQPEGSIGFGERGGGWPGVYRWCKQSATRGRGRIARDCLVLDFFDALVIHVDADVAGKTYRDAAIIPAARDRALPCDLPCPPADATVDALRSVVLGWAGESATPDKVVVCVPSKSSEAWVVASLFPAEAAVGAGPIFECHANPESRLGVQKKSHRITKSQRGYENNADKLRAAWPSIAGTRGLPQARRFQAEMLGALGLAGR